MTAAVFMRGPRRSRRRRKTISVVVHPYSPGTRNALGNETTGWGPDRVLDQCVWAQTSATEPFERGRTASLTGGDLYVLDGYPPTEQDEVTLPDGLRYRVDGRPAVWGPNPYTGRRPGAVVHLTRTEG